MKKLLTITVLSLLASLAFAGNGTKSDTLVVSTNPAMRCENCAARIKQNVRYVKGTKKIEISVAKQTVTIIYDGTVARMSDFVAAFKKIGYEIKPVEK